MLGVYGEESRTICVPGMDLQGQLNISGRAGTNLEIPSFIYTSGPLDSVGYIGVKRGESVNY